MPKPLEFPFDFEFYNETNLPDPEFYDLAYSEITDLAKGHSDITGASVSLKELTSEETPHAYQAIVTLYVRPTNISAKEIRPSALDALQGALDAAIKQVREKREQLRNY
jgi:hypothetical protein